MIERNVRGSQLVEGAEKHDQPEYGVDDFNGELLDGVEQRKQRDMTGNN